MFTVNGKRRYCPEWSINIPVEDSEPKNPDVTKEAEVKAWQLSTAHMPCSDPNFGDVGIAPFEWGVVVFVPDDGAIRDSEMVCPMWLMEILLSANEDDIVYIVFDADAPECGAFEAYDWE